MIFEATYCADHMRVVELSLLLAADAPAAEAATLRAERAHMLRALEESATSSLDDVPAAWLRTRLQLSATEEQVLWLLIACEVGARDDWRAMMPAEAALEPGVRRRRRSLRDERRVHQERCGSSRVPGSIRTNADRTPAYRVRGAR